MKIVISLRNIFSRLLSFLMISSLLLVSFAFSQDGDRGVGVRKNNSTSTAKRLALVIGNSDYQHTSKLDNPVNDAADMTTTLESLGFEVISGTNQSKRQMEDMIRDFGNRLADSKGVGLFFYAGHGIATSGVNYLIPVDAKIEAEDEIQYTSVSINFLLSKLNSANNGFNMVILDACRNNPFARSWRNFRDIGDKGGLARVNAPTGTLIAYATKPGDVASDGDGRNGLYTSALLKQMKVKNVDVTKMLQNVRKDVLEQSGNKQVPFDESSLVGDFYFAGKGGGNSPTAVARSGEDVLWDEIARTKTKRGYESYIRAYPNGKYSAIAKLKLRTINEENDWGSIRTSKNRLDIENFIKSYPDGSFADEAKTRYELLSWESVKETTDANEIEAYLKEFPSSKNVEEAKKLLSTVNWESLGKEKDSAAARKYLSDYPSGKYAEEANAILKFETVKDLARNLLKYVTVGEFSEGLAYVSVLETDNKRGKKNGAYKWGYMDETGREVIPFKYGITSSFTGGIAKVLYLNDLMKKNSYSDIYIDKNGQEVSAPDQTIREGLTPFSKVDRVTSGYVWGFKDNTGNEIIPAQYTRIEKFSEELALVQAGNKYGFIDTNGNEVIPSKYTRAKSFSEGLASVSEGDRYGYIDKNGQVTIPLRYSSADSFSNGFAIVYMGGKAGVIDKTGRLVILLNKRIWCRAFAKDGIFGVTVNGKKGFADVYGNEYFDL